MKCSRGILSQIRSKLRDWAVWQARAGCYSQAALSSNDSKTLYSPSWLFQNMRKGQPFTFNWFCIMPKAWITFVLLIVSLICYILVERPFNVPVINQLLMSVVM